MTMNIARMYPKYQAKLASLRKDKEAKKNDRLYKFKLYYLSMCIQILEEGCNSSLEEEAKKLMWR